MFGKLKNEEIRQAFKEIAEEMEKACGDWENEPDNPKLTERIIAAVKEKYPEEFEE